MDGPLAISLFLAIAWQQGDFGKRRGSFFSSSDSSSLPRLAAAPRRQAALGC